MSRVLERVWMVSDHRYDPKDLGANVVHLHETRPHALSHANTEASDQQLLHDQREREARARFDALTDEQRTLIHWSKFVKGKAKKEREDYFAPEERKAREAGGWTFRRKEGQQIVMIISFVDMLTPDEIGERMGWGQHAGWRVKRKLRAIDGELMRYAIEKAWV